MDIKQSKKAIGNFDFDIVGNIIMVVIGVVILFSILTATFPLLVSSGSALNTTGFPLGSLFKSADSAGWYLLAAGVILVLVRVLMPKDK
jgi:uncharacterized membrane protein HdeD (DUF308 family)